MFLIKDTSANNDGTECTHPYLTNTGMCNLSEYSDFTDQKFWEVAFRSSYAFQEAVQAWNTITAELSRLGEVAENYRTAMCSTDAGIVGVSYYYSVRLNPKLLF